jgi:hypothetical protein
MPWVLTTVGSAVVITGAVRGDGPTMAIGAIGLAGVAIGFPFARLVAGEHPPPDETGDP